MADDPITAAVDGVRRLALGDELAETWRAAAPRETGDHAADCARDLTLTVGQPLEDGGMELEAFALERAGAVVPVPPAGPAVEAGSARPGSSGRLSWPTRLRRVFAIEGLVCPRCAGPRRILGAVTEPPAVRRVLVALGLAPEPPPGRPITAA